jgi:hypothetical protein
MLTMDKMYLHYLEESYVYYYKHVLSTKCKTDVAATEPSAALESLNISCEVLGCSPVKDTERIKM